MSVSVENDVSVGRQKSPTAARQGETGHNMRYVLGFSLVGIVAAFILIGTYMGLTLPITAP
jgi:hypothetical protein